MRQNLTGCSVKTVRGAGGSTSLLTYTAGCESVPIKINITFLNEVGKIAFSLTKLIELKKF